MEMPSETRDGVEAVAHHVLRLDTLLDAAGEAIACAACCRGYPPTRRSETPIWGLFMSLHEAGKT